MSQSSVPSKTHRAAGNGRLFVVANATRPSPLFKHVPPIPVMSATRILIDLLLNQSVLDLKAIVEVILTDVGAALQVLRTVALDGPISDRRTGHIESGVLHLGRTGLRRAISIVLPSSGVARNDAAKPFWLRSQITSELARLLAKDRRDVCPNDAALAGLLREVGHLPKLLGWRAPGIDLSNAAAVGSAMAREWRLPFHESLSVRAVDRVAAHGSTWCGIVDVAWERANALVQRSTVIHLSD